VLKRREERSLETPRQSALVCEGSGQLLCGHVRGHGIGRAVGGKEEVASCSAASLKQEAKT
jgi:hypothetical protein